MGRDGEQTRELKAHIGDGVRCREHGRGEGLRLTPLRWTPREGLCKVASADERQQGVGQADTGTPKTFMHAIWVRGRLSKHEVTLQVSPGEQPQQGLGKAIVAA